MKTWTIKCSLKSSNISDGVDTSCETELKIPAHIEMVKFLGQNPKDMLTNFHHFVCLAIAKGITYGNSWRKHGVKYSIFPNCLRKVDRVQAGIETDNPDAICDGAADAAVYFELLLQYVMETYPDKYEEWLKNDVQSYIDKYLNGKK